MPSKIMKVFPIELKWEAETEKSHPDHEVATLKLNPERRIGHSFKGESEGSYIWNY